MYVHVHNAFVDTEVRDTQTTIYGTCTVGLYATQACLLRVIINC